jgi:GntR family transcriptional repressor for pyruvate dehydrogenase complex
MADDDDDSPGDLKGLKSLQSSSVAVTAAKALRNEILQRVGDNLFLGSEDQLAQRLGVSRPTFRQAARLLEYEELLTIRRGVGGGFFRRKPSAKVVARMAGIYLLAQGTSFADVLRAQFPLRAEVLRLLADNPDRAVRGRLSAFIENSEDMQQPDGVPAAIRAINHFWRLACELAGNNALALFVHASEAYGAKAGGLMLTSSRISAYVTGLAAMSRAIEAGDAEMAIGIARAFNEKALSWTLEDTTSAARTRKPRASGQAK